jgi:PKD repeat protein
VANTDQAPVSCEEVDIRLSTDGGYTYPVTIVAGVANDGSEEITVPDEATTAARVRVECASNVFFDISDEDFTIEEGEPVAPVAGFTSTSPDYLGETTDFTNTSTGTGLSFVWNFGDGSPTSTEENPSHTYAAAGTYTVSLTATNVLGSSTFEAEVLIMGEWFLHLPLVIGDS